MVSNRTEETVRFAVADHKDQWRQFVLRPYELVPVPVDGETKCRLGSDGAHLYRLLGDSIYLIERGESTKPSLRRYSLAPASADGSSNRTEPGGVGPKALGQLGTIGVKVLVDDNEVRRRDIWQATIRRRLENASRVLEYFCRLRLKVLEFDAWVTKEEIQDLDKALGEFESRVQPGSADLVIGFSSQYASAQKRAHAGGTRGPLQRHILIREAGLRVSEAEKLEILLHELGHYLGAAHSPDPSSIMRPVLGGGRANSRDFRLAYDPLNTLAMNIVSEQWRYAQVRRLGQLPSPAKRRLAEIYVKLAQLAPEDAEPLSSLMLVTGSSEPGARAVAQVVLRAARANQARVSSGLEPYREDALMSLYVRSAAAAARRLPKEHSVEAFLLGLGMALERDHVPGRFSPIANRFQRAESAAGRRRRLSLVGRPTVQGSAELSRHFLGSGVLAFAADARTAATAGLNKELHDATVGTGFSFPKLAANLAGIQLAQQLREGRLDLGQIEQGFSVSRFVPSVEDLPDELSIAELRKRLGAPSDNRFRAAIGQLEERIRQLPGYQPRRTR